MQARLELAELLYILDFLNAKQLIGVPVAEFSLDKPEERNATISHGFELLKEHGWLQPVGRKYKTNVGIIILVATIAFPEKALLLNLYTANGNEQVIGYYKAGDVLVEQIRYSDGSFILTQLSGSEDVITRLTKVASLPTPIESKQIFVDLDINVFKNAVQLARDNGLNELDKALAPAKLSDDICRVVRDILGDFHPTVRIDRYISNLNGSTWKKSSLVCTLEDERSWLLEKTSDGKAISVCALSQEQLLRLLRLII